MFENDCQQNMKKKSIFSHYNFVVKMYVGSFFLTELCLRQMRQYIGYFSLLMEIRYFKTRGQSEVSLVEFQSIARFSDFLKWGWEL